MSGRAFLQTRTSGYSLALGSVVRGARKFSSCLTLRFVDKQCLELRSVSNG
jgi:hypothetical protein